MLDSEIGTVATNFNIPNRITYITTIYPANDPDKNYLFGGGSYTLIGMEYENHKYGYQFATCGGNLPGTKHRALNKGIWSNWETYVTNTDLGNATFWFPTFVLGWDSYTNGTHQLTQSIANKPLLICAGKNGSLSGFLAKTQANDDRVIMTPEGAITIHFDSLTQVTITGATSTWNVRSIQIF